MPGMAILSPATNFGMDTLTPVAILLLPAPRVSLDIESVALGCGIPATVCDDIEQLLATAIAEIDGAEKSHIVIMSNGGFEGFHQRLVAALQ